MSAPSWHHSPTAVRRLCSIPPPVLSEGNHSTFGQGTCALEVIDWIDRTRRGAWVTSDTVMTDRPACVSAVLGAFVRTWNDGLPSDEDRGRLLGPLLHLLLDTATTAEDEERRAWMATDWLARVCAPAWLVAAGLHEIAAELRELAPLVDDASAMGAQAKLSAAYSGAESAAYSAAESAAYSAAESAAESAAYSVARSAAYSAAESVARSAAYSVARSAAYSVARSAARSALGPTVEALQASAVQLVRDMCAIGRAS